MQLPDQINEDLVAILGMMNFQICPIAHAWRDAGADIPEKTEAEQAHVLFKLLGLYAKHGAKWRKAAGQWLSEITKPKAA